MSEAPAVDRKGPLSIATFSLGEMLRCGAQVRRATVDAPTLEAAASAIVRYLYDAFRNEAGDRSFALVRCFATCAFGSLDAELQQAAMRQAGGAELHDDTRCLTLMATAGAQPEWNDRTRSRGHRAIPLPSPEVLERAPMLAALVRQMGLDVAHVVSPGIGLNSQVEGKAYDVFFVPDAVGSPYIPAQEEFVRPFGIRSVLGFGGLMQSDFFAFILFSREAVPESSASRFRSIALDAKLALLRHDGVTVFEG
jgi:hypothetical protein